MVFSHSVFLLSKLRSRSIHSRFESNNLSALLQWDRAYITGCGSENVGQDMTFNKLPVCVSGSVVAPKKHTLVRSCHFSQSVGNGPDLSRDFFVQLWVESRKRIGSEAMKRQKRLRFLKAPVLGERSCGDVNLLANKPPGQSFSGQLQTSFPVEGMSSEELGRQKLFTSSVAPVVGVKSSDDVNPFTNQPPTSQAVSGPLKPSSPEEARIAPLLARADLLVTRDIEWANLVAGIEQENRYNIIDVCYPSTPVGFIREQSNLIVRQLLRSRRPFVAHILDGFGNELFRVRRPFWWINSTIYTEINGKEIGVVHRRWHLWRRIYDLYLGNKQFAVVENPGFWNWTFTLKDIDGAVLAQIDRNWRGFGFELFTDAGQYLIKFGHAESSSVPLTRIPELPVKRPLTLSERAVAVALAVSLDNDYFSTHGGWHLPFMYVGE